MKWKSLPDSTNGAGSERVYHVDSTRDTNVTHGDTLRKLFSTLTVGGASTLRMDRAVIDELAGVIARKFMELKDGSTK